MKAIITVSANASQNEQTCIGPNELTRQLVSKPCVERLVNFMLRGGNALTVGVGIIIEVIRKNNSDYDPDGPDTSTIPSSRDPIYLGTLLRTFADHVPDFMALMANAPAQQQTMKATFGGQVKPLGFDRFKTCELMAELLHCSNMGLLNEVGSEELIEARDVERQRLRAEGKLTTMRGEEALSLADELTMRISHGPSSPVMEPSAARKLEVTNMSAPEDDGFEEVTHAADEDASGVEDIPELPDFSAASPGMAQAASSATSFLDKDDDDFVDEPLSSPRLHVREVEKEEGDPFEEPDLVVAPLSPTKTETGAPADSEKTTVTDAEEPEKGEEIEPVWEDKPIPIRLLPELEVQARDDKTDASGADTFMSAEDTPAPLFSSPSKSHAVSEPSDDRKVPAAELGETEVESQPQLENPGAPANDEAAVKPVVGDYLKQQFMAHSVVPQIIEFFFACPWNNFLHNVVYDIVQQVSNGPMDRGHNATLAVSLFADADITTQIIAGQAASEESEGGPQKIRLGYMGHLTLISEEVVKFTERHHPELLGDAVLDRVMDPAWIAYVEGPLAATRERDNAILGGVRPEVASMNRAGPPTVGAIGGLQALGSASSALADAGLNGSTELGEAGGSGNGNGIGPFAISAGTTMSGFGSSSDEDEDEETEDDINNEVSTV